MIRLRKKYVAAFGLLVTMLAVGLLSNNRLILNSGATATTTTLPTSVNTAADWQEQGLPVTLGEAIQATRYNVRPVNKADNTIEAHNPAQNLRASFSPEQVQFQSTSACQQPWELGLKLKGYGYGAQLQKVSEGIVSAKGNRVEIKHSHAPNSAQIVEWYTNTPQGIEQGFLLHHRPAQSASSDSMRVVMELQGEWKAKLEPNGQAVTLQQGSAILHYDQLHTFDATGRELASRMEVNGTELALVIDDKNALWPLTIDPTISQQTQLISNNGAAYDRFGYAVAISGDTAIVGVPDNDAGGTVNQGAAYIFVRNGSTWSQQAQLLASDAMNSDAFGLSVAISGDTALVGAYTDDVGSNGDQGSAYVFVRSGTTWSQQAKLTASDGSTNDWFGYAVALSGNLAVIGAPLDDASAINQGSAYVFVRNGATWSQETRMTANDAADNDNFGFAVTLSNDTAVIGSPADDLNGNSDQGSAYVFVRSGTAWSQQQKLTAINGASNDQFGYSVALSGNTAVIGAPLDDVSANINQGSAYVFVRSGTAWSQQQQITAINGAATDQFGSSVTIHNDMAVIGAPTDDVGSNTDQGSAYVFVRYNTMWSQEQQLTASNGAAHDNLGWSIALSGFTVVVGSPHDDVGSNSDQGSAYIFAPNCPSITLNPTTLANGTQNLAYPATAITPSSGTAPFTYEISSGSLPSGLTLSASGVLSGTPTVSGNFNFTVKITDTNLCVGSRAFSLTIASCAPPSVTTQPANQTSQVAGSASFTAAAGGTPPTAQWQVSTDNGNNWTNLTGATNTTLTLTNLAITMNGNKYRAVFTNACGTATSNAATLTVNKLTPTVALNSSSPTVTYGQSVTLTATVSGTVAATGSVTFKNGTTTLGTGTLSNGQATFASSTLNTGTYAITAEYGGDANYLSNTSSALTQTINKAILTVTAENKSKTYGAANPDLTATITGFVNGDTSSAVSGVASLNTTATPTSSVGSYLITVTQGTLSATNYNFTFLDGNLTISKAVLTVTAENKTRVYGASNPLLTATITGFINGDTIAVVNGEAALTTTAAINSAAASYPITVTQGTLSTANYDFVFINGSLTVGKAVLTVTAENKSRLYGMANPALTASMTGFVNEDSSSVISGEAALSTTATNNSAAGNYPITPLQGSLAAANYEFTFVPGTLTIGKATLTVTAENKNRTYGATNPAFSAVITGFVNGESSSVVTGEASFNTTAMQSSPAGTYPITVAQGTLAAANYDFIFVDGALNVGKALLTITADNKSRSYGATNPVFTTTITGFVNGDSLNSLSGEAALSTTALSGSDVGAYPITATPGTLSAANYDFSFVNGTLTIGKATLTVTAENKSRAYGAANPALTVRYTGFVNNDNESVLTGALEITTAATPGSAIGNYPITVKPGTLNAVNYQLVLVDGTLTIGKAVLSAAAENAARSYGAANPVLTGSLTGLQNNDNITASFTTSATAASAVGTYDITPAINDPDHKLGNYEFTLTKGTLTVTPAALTITAENKSRVYGAVNPEFTVTVSGFVNGETTSVLNGQVQLTTTANAASPVGSYSITASGLTSSNYSISFVPGTLTISKAVLTITADGKARTYGAANPELTMSIAGFVNGDNASVLSGTASLTTTATPSSSVGIYPITAAAGTLAAANYDFTFMPGKLTIGKASLTVTAEHKSRPYGTANPTFTTVISGWVNGDTQDMINGAADVSTSATQSSGVGTYPITVAQGTLAAANYDFTFVNGTLSIGKAMLTVTADNKNRNYGAANPSFTTTITGFVNNDSASSLTGEAALTTTATPNSSVGTYPITITQGTLAAANYDFTFVKGDLIINKATLTVTAEAKTRAYGEANPTLTATLTGFVNGETTSVVSGEALLSTTATPSSAAGAYPITAATGTLAAANYNFTFVNGTLTISKALLTVTADNKARAYGAENPIFTVTLSGFVNGDTASVVSGEAVLSTTATTTSAVNTYPLTVTRGTLAAVNYDFTFVNGTLTVNKAVLTVTADNKFRAYGVANPAFTTTISGFVNGDSLSSLSGEVAVTTSALASSGVGIYPIMLTQGTLAAANYDFTFVNGELTVNKAMLTVTAENKSKTYGAANPNWSATLTGFVNGETISVVSGEAALSAPATPSSNVGTYPITVTQGTLAAANYDFTFINGTLTISKAQLTVTADNKSRTYGAANPALTATITGFVNGETSNVVGGEAALSTTATAGSAAGAYPITVAPGTLTAENYEFTFVNSTLTISKATLTVTAENKAKVFGAALPELTFSYTGFLNGDSVSVITGTPGLTTTATASSQVGQYPINVSADTLTAASYDFVIVNGTLTITTADTTVALVSNAPSALLGQRVTFTATLTPVAPGAGMPSGSVTFKNGATTLGTAQLTNGQAELTTDQLALGTHAITAIYSGADNFNASTSSPLSQAVGKSAATVTLASALDTVRYGQSVTLNATVSGTGATPTGSVLFMNGASLLGATTLAGGAASLTINTLPVATHTITAVYEGDAQNEGGTSRSFSLTVNKAQPTLQITSSANPAALKQFVTLAINLSNVTPGVSLPTGTIVFQAGSVILGTTTIDRLGRAIISTNQLTAGAHTITAAFSGDGNYEASQAAGVTLTVGKGLTVMRLTSDAKTTTYGQSVSFSAAVYSAGETPTGIVAFYTGTTLLGEAPLHNGVAVFSASSLSEGEHAIKAIYKGADSFAGCQSAALKHTISTYCTWNLPTTNLTFNLQGGLGQIPVDSLTDCYWYAYTNNSWITINDFGPEVGVVRFTVAPLTSGTSRTGTIFVADKRVTIVQSKPTESVSGASYQKGGIAANSIVSVFGDGMASSTELAQAVPLPTTLANTRVKITDRTGVEHFAPLFYVAPLQLNYQVPANIAEGTALVTILNGAGEITGSGLIEIVPISPAVFSANSNGRDVASAVIQRVRLDGSQSYEQIAQYDPAHGKVVPLPIDFGEEGEELYLALFGTGVRSRIDLLAVRVLVNNEEAEVLYADVQGYFVGVDQINLKLPRKLAGKGEVDVKVVIEGKVANTVRITLR
jgi:hypothetical protein